MIELFNHLPDSEIRKIHRAKQPDWVDPMLATLTDQRFSDENWIFERKLDGERCLTFQRGGKPVLMSRNQEKLNEQYPELTQAMSKMGNKAFVVDGEIVAFEGSLTSFSKLQERMHISNPDKALQNQVRVYYYLFDILFLDGYDVSQVGQRHRKSLLKSAFSFEYPVRFVNHRNRDGNSLFQEACDKRWEGIIAKQSDAPYVHSRSNKWLKFKCVMRQELVIGGYTEPHGSRIGFGALLLGYYEDQQLIYAGKVGTGFDDEALKRLKSKLRALERKQPTFERGRLPEHEVHWVKPDLVAQIGFEEWTSDGKLRQPRFLGLRTDKPARKVKREEPVK